MQSLGISRVTSFLSLLFISVPSLCATLSSRSDPSHEPPPLLPLPVYTQTNLILQHARMHMISRSGQIRRHYPSGTNWNVFSQHLTFENKTSFVKLKCGFCRKTSLYSSKWGTGKCFEINVVQFQMIPRPNEFYPKQYLLLFTCLKVFCSCCIWVCCRTCYLLQSADAQRVPLHPHVQSAQLQVHGGHIQRVGWIQLAELERDHTYWLHSNR